MAVILHPITVHTPTEDKVVVYEEDTATGAMRVISTTVIQSTPAVPSPFYPDGRPLVPGVALPNFFGPEFTPPPATKTLGQEMGWSLDTPPERVNS